MSKRKLLIIIALSIVLTITACSNGSSPSKDGDGQEVSKEDGKKIEIKVDTYIGTTDPSYERYETFLERINEATDDAFEFKLFPSSQLGDYTITYPEVSRGSIEMSINTFPPQMDARGDIGILLYAANTWDDVDDVFGKGSYVYGVVEDIYKNLNMKFLGFEIIGFCGTTFNTKAPDNLWDPTIKKDLLIRTPAGATFTPLADALGYTGTTIAWSEVFSALQTKTIDGTLGATPSLCYTNFRDVAKAFVPYNYSVEKNWVGMNLDLWNSLTTEQQAAVQQAADQMFIDSIQLAREEEEKYFQMLEDYGVEIIQGTPEQLEAVASNVRKEIWPIYEEILGTEIYNDLMELYQ